MESDTGSWPTPDASTCVLDLVSGQHLRIVTGALSGLKGVVVARRQSGVLLIQVGSGMYLEVSEFCVKPEGAEKGE